MKNPVVYFEVIGKDPDKLQSYYSELFEWQIEGGAVPGYGLVQAEHDEIGGGIGGTHVPDYAGHATFYVQVPDVEAALVKAEQLGGTRAFGPAEVVEGVVIGLFTDPEGHLIGVLQG